MSDGQETFFEKDRGTIGEEEEKQVGDGKIYKIQSAEIPQKVTKIEVYFERNERLILSIVIHGQEGDPLWVGWTEQSDIFKKLKGRKETFEVP